MVFVEVKYRKDDKKGYPAQAVDQRKQQKIRKSAMIYLKKNHLSFEQPIRFDVVEILGKKIRVINMHFKKSNDNQSTILHEGSSSISDI